MKAGLRARIRSGEATIGTFLNLGSPLAAEACALAGFDWLLADLEHGGGGEDSLIGQLLAAETHRVPVIVRVESHERIRAGRALDLGAGGVMFPRLDTDEQAVLAVTHLRYPPKGDRGVATYNRACGFGMRLDNLDTANDSILCVVQIESARALENVEAIAMVDGVDVLFVGPRDLTSALGVAGRFDAPEYREALARVVAAARSAGVAAGILVADSEHAAAFLREGFRFVAVGSDSTFVAAGAHAASSVRADHAAKEISA